MKDYNINTIVALIIGKCDSIILSRMMPESCCSPGQSSNGQTEWTAHRESKQRQLVDSQEQHEDIKK